MKFTSRALIGTVAAGAMALATASPAMARDRERGGIDGGDILAGVLVLGGIAAVAAAAGSNNNRRDRGYEEYRYDRGYGDDRYGNRHYRDRYDTRGYHHDYQQDAVALCIRAAESTASRYTYGGRAQVYDIRDIDRERDGFEVKGRIAVQERSRGYGRVGQDTGQFSCEVRRGRVVDLDFSGIRGL